MTKEDMREMEVKGMAEGLTYIMDFLATLIQLLGKNDFPRIWALGEDDVSIALFTLFTF